MTVRKCAIDLATLDLRESSLAWMTTIRPYLRTNRIVHFTIATIQVVNLVPRPVSCALRMSQAEPPHNEPSTQDGAPHPGLAGGENFDYGPIAFTTPEI